MRNSQEHVSVNTSLDNSGLDCETQMTVCLINVTPVSMYAGQLTLNLVAAVMTDSDRQGSSTQRQQLVSWCQKLASMPADDIFSASSPVLYAPIVSTKHRTSRSVIRLVT